jgi:hypothetical protein
VSDRGSLFTSHFWAEVCYATKIKRRLSTAFHPQTDGQTERQNQTLEQYLRAYVDSNQDNWAAILPLAEFAYNNSVQASTGLSPFFACYGFHPRLDCEPSAPSLVPAVAERIDALSRARESAEQHWQHAVAYQKRYYDSHHRPQVFNVGDRVWLSSKNLRLRVPSRKLAPQWLGPFKVEQVIGHQAYKLTLPGSMPVHPVFHTSVLKPYVQRDGDAEALPGPIQLDETDVTAERYEVETLLKRKKHRNQIQYLVKWKGWPEEYNEWVAEHDIDKSLVEAFKKSK